MFAKFSVKKPLTVFVAVMMVVILGFVSFTKMTPDLLPSVNLPYAIVITSYPGATPEEVETQISKPLEQAMAALENIEDINSTSAENMSQIMLQFSDGANMDAVVSDIREKINGVSGYWDDKVGTPYIIKLNPDLLPVTVSAVEYKGMSTVALTEFLNNELMSQLEGISGVASVSVSGNVQEQISLTISESKLKTINDKIKKSLDEKFGDAEKEFEEKLQDLQDGKSELEGKQSELNSAKSGLEAGQSALINQTAGAQGQLIDKKLELESAKTELKAQIASAQSNLKLLQEVQKLVVEAAGEYKTLQAQRTELDAAIAGLTELKNSYSVLVAQRAELERKIAEQEAAGAPTESSAVSANATLEELRLELETVNAQIAAADAAFSAYGTTAANVDAKLTELQLQKTALLAVIDGVRGALTAAGVDPDNVDAALADMQTNITAIEGGIVQLEAAIQQLEGGSMTVSDALAELNRQQMAGTMKISDGLTQIAVGKGALESAKAQMDSAETQMDDAQKELDKQKETAYKNANVEITMDMVNQILMAQNFSMPVGYITDGDVDYMVRVGDKISSTEELSSLVLFDTGIDSVGKIHLSDVADVVLTDNADTLYAKINGNDGVILSFSKQSTYATATVSKNVAEKFKALSEKYDGLRFANLSDQGDYIDVVINSVLQNLVLGAILAVLILLLFLKDIKPTAVIACSIPISVLFAIVLMYFSGITLNIISLSGLAVGVGMLVDNSVVVIENIYRMRGEGQPPLKAAVKGAVQVTGAIVASTLTTICVFLPIVFVEGLTRQIFTDLALTIAYSLLASLIVAITLVPAMASGMLAKNTEKNHKLFDKFLNGYERLARLSIRHKWVVIALSLVLLVVSTAVVFSKGFIFMPAMSGTQISVTITPPEDATFDQQKALADKVYERVSTIDDLETIGTTISSGGGMSMMGGSGISMYAILSDNSKRKDAEISKEIIEKCADLDCEITAQGAMDMGSYMTAMSGAGVSMNVYGTELDDLIAEAEKLGETIKNTDGIGAVTTGIEDTNPEIRIVVDKEKAMGKGLTVAQVYQLVAVRVKAEAGSTTIKIDNYDKDIVIYSEQNQKTTVNDVKNMILTVTDKEGKDEKVRLSSIANIEETKSLNSISRSNQRRYLTVTAEIAEGYNVTKVTDAVRSDMASYSPTEGNTIEIGGESDTIMDAVTQLAYMALLAIVIIYFIMVAQFQSFKSPFIVMFTIPLACTGGFLALLLTGKDLSVVSIVGFIMLAGIIVNNGIVLIDYINTLRLEGMEKREAIIQASRTRMRPILMTALTTVLGLVFMAIATGFGAELMQPMAIVCIGGLLYGTLMTLFVVPAMYDVFSRKEMKPREVD